MPGTPYNPEKYPAQSGIVQNYRDLWGELHNCDLLNYELTLTDAEIWDSYDSFCDAEAEDDVFPELRNRYDAMVLQDIRYKQEQFNNGEFNIDVESLPVIKE